MKNFKNYVVFKWHQHQLYAIIKFSVCLFNLNLLEKINSLLSFSVIRPSEWGL